MPTVSVNGEIYSILKKLSRLLNMPMSRIIEIALLKFFENINECNDVPPELKLEINYFRLQEIYRIYRMAKAIYRWVSSRTEYLEDEKRMIDWTPIRKIAEHYIKELEEAYIEIEKSFENQKMILEKARETLEGEAEKKEKAVAR